MNRQLHTTVHLLRHFGPGWLMFRAGYAFRKRSGAMKRALPATSWDAQPLARFLGDPRLTDPRRYAEFRANQRTPFLFDATDRPTFHRYFVEWDEAVRMPHSRDVRFNHPVAIADGLCDGVFRFFEHREINLGIPPNWHRHPVTGDEFPGNRHWSQIGDFAASDIKYVWEPSRFAWVYPLTRVYWRTGDERYPRLFWELFEDWRTHNPPQQGVNWKCGQEIALRVMACCFGLYGFSDSPESTPERIALLAQMMAVSAQRIEANLSYGVSQQNNHGISEATGLWTLGLLFPEFTDAARWARIGRESLENQCRKLIDDDGAFSQHSVNYQRVMLHDCLWAIRLGELHQQPLSDELRQRVGRAGEFLWQMQDETTGRLPRYGANDGALVLPLTNCPAEDYRPIVQSAAILTHTKRRFESGPWDEESLWLFGTAALETTVESQQRVDWHAPDGGYCVLRSETGHVFARAGSYRHRPAHADMLHLDVWWRGENVAIDPGTYTYNGHPPWDSPLGRTAFHNTVTVGGHDQMDRRGRFLWLPWLSGERVASGCSPSGHLTYWEGTHDGYRRLSSPASYRRGVLRIGSEHWLVVDSLSSNSIHDYRLHWLLPDVPYLLDEARRHLRLNTPAGPYDVCVAASGDASLSFVRADQESPRGWYAPSYGDRGPALSLACIHSDRTATFWTLLGPAILDVDGDASRFQASTENWTCRVERRDSPNSGNRSPGWITASISGSIIDELSVVFASPPYDFAL